MKQKVISIELLRIIACFLVIAFHCDFIVKPCFERTIYGFGAYCIYHISTIGLPLFFIITSISLYNTTDYLSTLFDFYKKRLIYPGLPFYFMSIFYYLWNHWDELRMGNLATMVCAALERSLQEPQHYHLWFVYSWLGLTILLPFLKRFLNALSYKELKHLVMICVFVKIVTNYSLVLINEFYFSSWVVYYILGYYLLKEETKRKYKLYYGIGSISFCISLLIHFEGYENTVLGNHLFDISPLMIFQVAAIFCFFVQLSKLIDFTLSKRVVRIIEKLSGCTVWIYLWHPFFLTKYGNYFLVTSNYIVRILCVASAVFFMSLTMSLICRLIQSVIFSRIIRL